ncbi:MAG: hypothetical protein ACJ779_03825 [Chloroflexota bacterium]
MEQIGVAERALLVWPRLDRRKLAKCADDPSRIARLVATRTNLPTEVIVAMLTQSDRREDEANYYFG